MRKALTILVVVLAALGGYFYASPYLALHNLKEGIQNKDTEKLSDYIDFPSVRQNLKEQLNAAMMKNAESEMKDNPFGALGAVFATKLVDGIVDSFVTPSAIASFMQGETKQIQNKDTTHNKIEDKSKNW